MEWLEKHLNGALRLCYDLCGNYGLAIILFHRAQQGDPSADIRLGAEELHKDGEDAAGDKYVQGTAFR